MNAVGVGIGSLGFGTTSRCCNEVGYFRCFSDSHRGEITFVNTEKEKLFISHRFQAIQSAPSDADSHIDYFAFKCYESKISEHVERARNETLTSNVALFRQTLAEKIRDIEDCEGDT